MSEVGRLARLEPDIRRRLADTVTATFSLRNDPPDLLLVGSASELSWLIEEMSGEYLISAIGTAIDAELSPDDAAILRFVEKVDRACTFAVRETIGPFRLPTWWRIGDMPLTYACREDTPEKRPGRFGRRSIERPIGECP